jgi:hypothetical protein
MKLHKHMRDMRDLLRFKAYFQFNITFYFTNILRFKAYFQFNITF